MAAKVLTSVALGLWALGGLAELEAAGPPRIVPKAPSKDTKQEEDVDPKVKLNYFSANWQKVFEDLAEATNSQLVMDRVPTGRFSRRDGGEYSRSEAVRILNREIEPLGFRLVEKGPFLIVLDLPSQRPRYQPPVLAKPPLATDQTIIEEIEVTESPYPHRRAETVTPSKRGRTSSIPHRRDSDDVIPAGGEEGGRRSASKRRPASQRAVQASAIEADEDYADEVEDDAPAAPRPNRPASAPTLAIFRTRYVSATDLSRVIYRTFRDQAELIDAGRQGLPAMRVQGKPTADGEGSTAFAMAINEVSGELLIDAQPETAQALVHVLGQLDVAQGPAPIQLVSCTPAICPIAAAIPAQVMALRQQVGDNNEDANDAMDAPPADDPAFADDPSAFPTDPDAAAQPNANGSSNVRLSDVIGTLKGEVKVESVPDLGVLILRGNEKDVSQVMQVIRELEKLSEMTAPSVRLHYLKNVESTSLSELMTTVYERLTQFPGRATQPRQSVAIIPVDKPNSVLIIAPESDLESIVDLVKQLDQPVDAETEFQIFRLKSASATQVTTLLTDFYASRGGLGARVLVLSDARTNSVLVRARPRDLEEVAAMIRRLDLDDAASTSELKIFPLKNAVATELAAMMNAAIQSVLSPPTNTGNGGLGGAAAGLGGGQIDEKFQDAKSTVLQFLTVDEQGARKLRSGVLTDIRITPDARTNSLVVSAPEQSLSLITALIAQLDQPSTAVSEIKVFPLSNADAQLMVEQLQSLFSSSGTGGGGGGLLSQQQRAQLGILVAGAADASSSLIPIRFTVDRRTNSIIAIGGADALNVVEAIVFRLDESDMRDRKNTVYRLKNSPAANIAQAVNQFLSSQRDLNQLQPDAISGVEQLEQEVIVVAEPVSNSLMISATPRYYEEIIRLVQKLDEPPPQVIIQALIVEVQLDNNDEFGVELGFQDSVLFDRSVVNNLVTLTETTTSPNGTQTTSQRVVSQEASPGFNFGNPALGIPGNTAVRPSTVGSQGLSSFSLGRVNNDLGYGGLVLSASSESVSVLMRALAASRRVQVLSRPQIRTLDNQLAQILVGQVVPVVNGVNVTGTGLANPVVIQQEAGIILTVTPRISPDGQIVMEMVAEKSEYNRDGVPIYTDVTNGNVVEAPIKNISTARASISVPNNQTVVLGGMISTREDSSERKVPFLGDIPLVGLAFRYDSLTTTRSELLIFLTPRIIRDDCESEWIKEVEMGRIHFIEKEAEAVHGPLRAVPAEDIDGLLMGEPYPEGALPATVLPDGTLLPSAPTPVAPEPGFPAPTGTPAPGSVPPPGSVLDPGAATGLPPGSVPPPDWVPSTAAPPGRLPADAKNDELDPQPMQTPGTEGLPPGPGTPVGPPNLETDFVPPAPGVPAPPPAGIEGTSGIGPQASRGGKRSTSAAGSAPRQATPYQILAQSRQNAPAARVRKPPRASGVVQASSVDEDAGVSQVAYEEVRDDTAAQATVAPPTGAARAGTARVTLKNPFGSARTNAAASAKTGAAQ